ncbi:hypothetical protein BDQ17DRAFT_1441646 [Cyathus striatus]|nr:hypothetical protein BDQ17DRAFT_1441646 [Cyathus striatus]
MSPLQVDVLADLINNEQYMPNIQFKAHELLDVLHTISGWIFLNTAIEQCATPCIPNITCPESSFT